MEVRIPQRVVSKKACMENITLKLKLMCITRSQAEKGTLQVGFYVRIVILLLICTVMAIFQVQLWRRLKLSAQIVTARQVNFLGNYR